MSPKNPWRVPFNSPFISGSELAHIKSAIGNGRLSGDGYYTRRCHSWLETNLGCTVALLTHSGTSALEMAALLCDIGPGDEVIMPSFTFVSTANAFVLRGATPVFVDIEKDTLNIDPKRIENAITAKTKAIVPVHYGGFPCDMQAILSTANAHGLRVIEDAAHGVLSKNSSQYLGSIGDLGCLSFHETKNIISGEGGALLINDPELVDKARIIWHKGTNRDAFNRGATDKYTWMDQGSSFLPSELTAAFLFGQLEQAAKIIDHRLAIRSLYRESLKVLCDMDLVRCPPVNNGGKENGHLFYLLVKSPEQRDLLIEYLAAVGIGSAFHYIPLHSSPAGKKYGYHVGDMFNTDSTSARLLRLPVHGKMSKTDASLVVNAVLDFFLHENKS